MSIVLPVFGVYMSIVLPVFFRIRVTFLLFFKFSLNVTCIIDHRSSLRLVDLGYRDLNYHSVLLCTKCDSKVLTIEAIAIYAQFKKKNY